MFSWLFLLILLLGSTQAIPIISHVSLNELNLQSSSQMCERSEDYYFTDITCAWQRNVCRQTLQRLTPYDFDANLLNPGTLFRLNDQTISSRVITQEKVSSDYRNPLYIKFSNGLNATLSGVTQPVEFKQKLNDFLGENIPYLNGQAVELAIAEQSEVEKMMEKLGLSSEIYEELRIARIRKQPITFKKKIVIAFYQKFFTASLEIAMGVNHTPSSLNKYFFRNTTPQESQRVSNLIYDRENPLQYISKTNYGRLLVLSLNNNDETKRQIDRLQKCIGLGNIEYDCLNAVMRDIRFNPTLRYYFAGVDEALPLEENERCAFCRAFINWERVFFALNASSVQRLRPLSAQATSFRGQRYQQQEYRFFETQICKKSISIQVKSLGQGTSLLAEYTHPSIYSYQAPNDQFKGQLKKYLFNTSEPGIFQIGDSLGKGVFELTVKVKGKRISNGLKYFFLKNQPVYSIQAVFALLINREKKIEHIIGHSRSAYQFKEITIRVRSAYQFKEITIRVDPKAFSGNIIYVDEDD